MNDIRNANTRYHAEVDAIDELIIAGKREEAQITLSAVVARRQLPPNVSTRLAAQLTQLGLYEQAIDLYTRILTDATDRRIQWRCHIELGDLKRRFGRFMETAQHWFDAMHILPERPRPYIGFRKFRFDAGVRRFCLQQLDTFMQTCQEAHPLGHVSLGDLHLAEGDIGSATAHFQLGSWAYAVHQYPDLFRGTSVDARRMKPDFMILGAIKSGTTSLYNYTLNHPKIIAGVRKELHYFDSEQIQARGAFDLQEYLSYFPPDIPQRDFLIGEATPLYLYCRLQAFLNHELPDTRFVIILRAPAARAVSHYFHSTRNGSECKTITEALFSNVERYASLGDMDPYAAGRKAMEWFSLMKANRNYKINRYLLLGLYDCLLAVWFREMDRSRFLVVTQEQLSVDPETVVGDVHRFLGLDPIPHQDDRVWIPGWYDHQKQYGVEERLQEFYRPFMNRLKETTGIELNP
ncbi:MAG: sulfotransferase domain-containing protein [Verrucomicrobia bacterium]|nr:sulfotransferase domain-containing protein [Verrucomicrobiota bacterium]